MANIIKLKSSVVAAKVPTTADIAKGEAAVNHADKKLWLRNPSTDEIWDLSSGGAGSISIDTTADDLFSATSGTLSADDLGSDKIYFWDDSASRATGLEIGTGLAISGTTLNSTASGGSKTLATFTPRDHQPPATAFATLDTRNSIAVLDFDAATVESAIFSSVIPEAADLTSGLLVRLLWMATTATTGNCRWGVQVERANTDLDSDSYATAAEAHTAAPATSGIPTLTEITLTTIDGLTAGDTYRLKVYRKADDATNDTMTGDAELIAVEIRSAA
jgi:hypothetical protein